MSIVSCLTRPACATLPFHGKALPVQACPLQPARDPTAQHWGLQQLDWVYTHLKCQCKYVLGRSGLKERCKRMEERRAMMGECVQAH